MAWSDESRYLATAGPAGHIKVWDLPGEPRTSSKLFSFAKTKHPEIGGLAISPDGQTIASYNYFSVNLFDVASGRKKARLRCSTGWRGNLCFTSDGNRLLLHSTHTKEVYQWDLATGDRTNVGAFEDYYSRNELALSPDDRYLALRHETWFTIWDMKEQAAACNVDLTGMSVNAIQFSPTENVLATVGRDGTVRVWDIESGGLISSWQTEDGALVSLAFRRDGRVLATGADEGRISLWDISSRERVMSFSSGRPARSMVFSPSGDRLACGADAGGLQLWDLRSQRIVSAWSHPEGRGCNHVAFAPDGRTLACAFNKYDVQAWRLQVAESDTPDSGLSWNMLPEVPFRGWRARGAGNLADQQWQQPDFDDRRWSTCSLPLGHSPRPPARPFLEANSALSEESQLCLRSHFINPDNGNSPLLLAVQHQEPASIYLNGQLVEEVTAEQATGNCFRFITLDEAYLRPGSNVVAVTVAGRNRKDGVPLLNVRLYQATIGQLTESLVKQMGSDQWAVRSDAVKTLQLLGPAATPAVPALEALRTVDDFTIRNVAEEALKTITQASE